jgi:hypothetical protein
VATFDNTSDKNVTIDSAIDVLGIDINSGYDGTITQTATITVRASGYAQDAGTFSGGSQAIDVAYNGAFNVQAGSFTSTSGTLSVERNFTINGSAAFSANGGTITFDGAEGADVSTLSCGSKTFNLIQIDKNYYTADVTIGSDCTIPLGNSPTMSGDVITNNGTVTVGTGTWTINASYTQSSAGASTTFTGTKIDVNDRNLQSGQPGYLSLTGGTFTASSMTTLDSEGDINNSGNKLPTGLTLTLNGIDNGDNANITCSGTESFNTVYISKSYYTTDVTIGSDCVFPLGDNATVSGEVITNNGTVTVGTGTWTINASYTQSSAGASTTFTGTKIDVNDRTLQVNFPGYFAVTGGTFTASNMTLFDIQGNLDNSGNKLPTSLTLTLNGADTGDDASITCSGSESFTSVLLSKTSYDATIVIGSTCIFPLGNNATTSGGTITNNGTVNVGTGTWTINASYTQSNAGATTTFTGTTIDMNDRASDAGFPGALTLTDGTFTATSMTTLNMEGTLNNSGNKLPTGLAFTLNGTGSADSASITCSGNEAFASLTINKTNSSAQTTFASNCTTIGAFTRTDGVVNNSGSAYTLTVQGNFSMSTTDAFGGTNLTVKLSGSNTQNISQNAANTFSSPFIIDKTGSNPASLSTDLTTSTAACTVTEGIFNINGEIFTCGNTFTIEDGGTLRLIGSENPTTPTLNSGSTVEYVGDGDVSADTYNPRSWTYSNLTTNFTDTTDSLSSTDLLSTNLNIYLAMNESSWTNDCSTTSILDSSGNNHPGLSCPASTGSVGGTSGKINNGGYLDGNNDFLQIDNPNLPTGDFTYAFWINTTDTDAQLLFASNGSGGNEMWVKINGSNNLTVTTDGTVRINYSTNIHDGSWHHVAITKTGGYIYLYIDGVYKTSATDSSVLNFSSCPFLIGVDVDSGCTGTLGEYVAGTFDDVRVYTRAISPAEIYSLSQALTVSTISSLVISNIFTLSSGSFISPTTFQVGGNFLHTGGTFTHNSGTVVFNGTNQTITGSTTFNNLTKTTASTASLTFPASATQIIEGTLTLTGQANNLLSLISSSEDTPWNIDPQGARTISYLYVQDSNNTNASDIEAGCFHVTNGGNNDGWNFDGSQCSFTTFEGNWNMEGIKIN